MSDTSITSLSVKIPEGKELNIGIMSKKVYPNRYQIGSGMQNKRIDTEPMDAINIMSTFTPQEWFVINTLKEVSGLLKLDDEYKYYSSCIVSIKGNNLTDNQRNQFSTGFKRLRDKNIVRRIKRQEYIINPDFIIPTKYNTEMNIWNSL